MRVEVLKPTNDDWCGSYIVQGWPSSTGPGLVEQMFVEVIFNGMIGGGTWRTCVWGNDDCGMEFDCSTEAECWNKFLQVIGMESVDMVALRELGFVSA
jgi:hypothetical protein